LSETISYVDGGGGAVELPAADEPERAVTEIERDGRRIAAIVHDRALVEDRETVRAAGAATTLQGPRDGAARLRRGGQGGRPRRLGARSRGGRADARPQAPGGPIDTLTARERDVLARMAEGQSNRAIAARLDMTEHPLERDLTRILEKLALPVDAEGHRRVLAVLTYLRAH
jgi:DNA-binding CsgD family transcriptional regulator